MPRTNLNFNDENGSSIRFHFSIAQSEIENTSTIDFAPMLDPDNTQRTLLWTKDLALQATPEEVIRKFREALDLLEDELNSSKTLWIRIYAMIKRTMEA